MHCMYVSVCICVCVFKDILTPLMSGASRASRVMSFPAEFLSRSNQATGCRIMFVNASRRTLITSFSAAVDIQIICSTAANADKHARSTNMADQNIAAFLSSSPVRVNVCNIYEHYNS